MITSIVVRKNRYLDSVFLMQVAGNLQQEPGVTGAAAVMGTDRNKQVVADLGASGADLDAAGPDDLIIAVTGDADALGEVLGRVDEWLVRRSREGGVHAQAYRTFEDALGSQPGSNLVVISVPGEYAAREARRALDNGLNAFIFSSNVSLQDEIDLKQSAQQRGLIVMGPDCGTSIIAGIGLGFANAVRRGPIGVIGSSGTGLQEFTSIVDRYGSGISHAIGTGSRDLSDAVGGISTLQAFDALDTDTSTQVIGLISKPPGPRSVELLQRRAGRSSKPVVACFIGESEKVGASGSNIRLVPTLDDAAALAVSLVTENVVDRNTVEPARRSELIERESVRMARGQRYIRGLFAGGTFSYQAQQVMKERNLTVYSNTPLPGMRELKDPARSREHSIVDLGAEFFTDGRPHPMIESSLRRDRTQSEALDPEVAVILLDFILGYNASADPVGDLIESCTAAKRMASDRGGYLSIVASVCGTSEDFQDLERQTRLLREAGAVIMPSAAAAAAFSRDLALSLVEGT